MTPTTFKPTLSRNVLMMMAVFIIAIGAISFFNRDFILKIYFENQLTVIGQVVNSLIVVLFLVGILKVILLLFSYVREEKALETFLHNCALSEKGSLAGVYEKSLIAERYREVVELGKKSTPIDHGTLASLLVSRESLRTSLPKYIHNILILTGVFGTIVSLSLALLGASNLLESSGNLGEMNLVMHGMSTALSTTITAIVCYLLFGYFYLKLTDVQTGVISAIESATALYLLPGFSKSSESIVHDIADLVSALKVVAKEMQQAQLSINGLDEKFTKLDERIVNVSARHEQYLSFMSEKLVTINKTLHSGFRLPAPSSPPEN